MPDKGPSRTAAYVALFRALETRLPEDKRLFSDPFAEAFLTPPLAAALAGARVPVTGRVVPEFIDRRSPGVRASVIVRTRFIDEAVTEAIEGGVEQLVVLGAGFDARAYRLDAGATAHVFEVDEPVTQERKREVIAEHLDSVPAQVAWVPVDFERDDLVEALRSAGLDPSARTIVTWEGVTPYLTAEAVDATLRAITRLGSRGSRVIFTYLDRAVLDGTVNVPGARSVGERVRRAGEPFLFGLASAEVESYLAERGLELVEQVSSVELAARYLEPLGRRPPTSPFYNVVIAAY